MELLERQELLDDLVARLRDAASAGGRMAVVEGESGIGKTSVLRALAARAPANGLRVLWGACDALATPRPLGPLHDMTLRGATAARDRLEAGRPAHEAFEGLLADLATPSLAIVEDLHWADEATLDLVRFIGRRMDTTPSVLVVTLRDDEVGVGHPVRTVLGDLATSGLVRLRLEPLTVTAVRQLAVGHDVDPEELHRVTGGNPFYVTEVLAQPGATVPLSVRDAVLTRVGRLPEPSRALVELVSVEPGSFGRRLLRRLGQDDRAVDEGLRSAVLVDDGTGLRVRHELARRAVEDSLGPERAADLHRRLLEALAADPDADPARLAHHASAIDDPAAELRWSTAAAERAMRSSAHREAAAHYARAVRHVDLLLPLEGAALLASYAEVLSLVDQATRAVEVLEAAVERYEVAGDHLATWTTRAQLARAVWTAGRSAEGYALIDRVVEALESEEDDPRVAEAFAIGGYLAMLDRRTDDATAWAHRAIGLAEQHGQRAALALALNALGAARIVGREDLGGMADLRRSGEVAELLGNRRGVAGMYSNLGSGLGEIRRYELAVPALEDAVAYGAAHELELTRHYAMAWLARVRFEQGRWEEADTLATAAIGEVEASPISPMVALCARGRIRARRGAPGADEPLADAWRIAAASGDLQRTWPAIAGEAEAAWLAGRPATRILDVLAPVLDLARHRGVAWAIGECGFWMQRLGTEPVDPRGAAAPYAASLRGDHAAAAAAWTALGCPYEAAWSLADLDDEAHLRDALDRLMALGAAPLAARVRRRLHELGARGIPVGPRPSTSASPSGLTRRETEVLELLRAGLTDREIAERLVVSPRTVGHHVSTILAKLGVRRRSDAAAMAPERGAAGPATEDG